MVLLEFIFKLSSKTFQRQTNSQEISMLNPEGKILVTGVNGFVGGHLTEALADKGLGVVGCGMEEQPAPAIKDALDEYVSCDLTKADQVDRLPLSKVDGVIHLAGLAAVGPSFDNPIAYMDVNEGAVIELFEAAQRQEATPRFLIVSSGAVYSRDYEERDENTPIEAGSPYAASKLSSELWVEYYQNRGFDAVIARPFNHAGPNQGLGFIVPDFAQQVLKAVENPGYVIQVGNIATERDYTDVRDVVQAYIKLMMSDSLKHTLYNICSGKAVSGKEILDKLRAAVGEPDLPFEAEVTKMRPTDVPRVVGSYQRLHKDTDWEPKISFDQTISDTLDYWKNK